MRNIYAVFHTRLGKLFATTDKTHSECCLDSCIYALDDYMKSRSIEDMDIPMLRDFAKYVKRLSSLSSNNVIPLKNYTTLKH